MRSSGLDFGIMCSGFEFEDWMVECIRNLRDVDNTNLKVLIIDGDDPRNNNFTEKLTTISNYRDKTTTANAVNEIAWWLYRQPFDGPSCKSKTDLSYELNTINSINCTVEKGEKSRYISESDVDKICEYDLDFIINLDFGVIGGEILDVPSYGVWSYSHNIGKKYRGEPPCFWGVYEGDPITEALLQRETDRRGEGIILKRGFFPTKRGYHENLNNVYYGITEWPAQVAIDILNGNNGYIKRSATKLNTLIYRTPSPRQIALYNLKKWYSFGATGLSGIEYWNVGVLHNSIENSVNESFSPDINWYPYPKKDRFLADPFPININGDTYIFVEEYSYPERKGKISYIEYPDGFKNGDLRTAYEEPHHMAYPYLFKYNSTVYATPEICESGEIRLYRVHSPSDWEFETTLVEDTDGVDPTVIKYNNRWWMFYTKQSYSNTKLYIRYAKNLTGEWMPHKNNPVKTDIRSSRPGGTPFTTNAGLYRPAQNSAGRYGKGIVVNKIKHLTPTVYIEDKVGEISPSKKSPYTGMHTLSSQGGITLIDAKKAVKNRYTFQRRISQIASELSP